MNHPGRPDNRKTRDAFSDETVNTMLESAGLDPVEIKKIINTAFDEDLRWGPDITTDATSKKDAKAVADIVARQNGTIAGIPIAIAVLSDMGLPAGNVKVLGKDGDKVSQNDKILQIIGPLRKILVAERTLLNFMTHLSGIATVTRAWVEAIEGVECIIRDTRKTTPGLRSLEKYAVRCGGGSNHRMGLGDAALIKDNHVLAAGGIKEAIKAVREADPDIFLEVECDTIDQVREALSMDVRLILLDNMGIDQIKSAVALGKDFPLTRFEASGGLSLDTARKIAETGIDYMAIGGITHSSPALDLALDIRS